MFFRCNVCWWLSGSEHKGRCRIICSPATGRSKDGQIIIGILYLWSELRTRTCSGAGSLTRPAVIWTKHTSSRFRVTGWKLSSGEREVSSNFIISRFVSLSWWLFRIARLTVNDHQVKSVMPSVSECHARRGRVHAAISQVRRPNNGESDEKHFLQRSQS